jgi:hypothetical protein
VGTVLVLVAIGLAIYGIRRARVLPGGGGAVGPLVAGLGLAGLMLLFSVTLALQWPAQWEYQQCQGTALTQQAQDDCFKQYEKDTMSVLRRIASPR